MTFDKTKLVQEYTNLVKNGQTYEQRNDWLQQEATRLNVTVPQLRGVLTHSKVYVGKVGTSSPAGKPTARVGLNKRGYRLAMETALGVPTGALESMEKMSGQELKTLWDAFVKISEQRNAALGK